MKWTRWGAKSQRNFPAEIANSSGFSGWIQVISKKKKKKRSSPKLQGIFRLKSQISKIYPKNVTKSGVSPPKTLIWTSICAPEAPSLLISSEHSPPWGGTIFVWGHKQSVGGARPRYGPRGAGSGGTRPPIEIERPPSRFRRPPIENWVLVPAKTFFLAFIQFRRRNYVIFTKVLSHAKCVWSRLQKRPPMQNFTI